MQLFSSGNPFPEAPATQFCAVAKENFGTLQLLSVRFSTTIFMHYLPQH